MMCPANNRRQVSGLVPLLSKFGFQSAIPRSLLEPEVSGTEQEAEVVGPADTNHLSQVANFRQALSEVQAQLKTQAQASSPTGTHPSARTPAASQQQVATPAVTAHTAIAVPTPLEASALGMDIGLTEPLYALHEDTDYMQLAAEMSNYMTWDFSELPPWIDFDHHGS